MTREARSGADTAFPALARRRLHRGTFVAAGISNIAWGA